MFAPPADTSFHPPWWPLQAFLNNALDVVPCRPLPISTSEWTLHYRSCAIEFPIVQVEVLLRLPEVPA